MSSIFNSINNLKKEENEQNVDKEKINENILYIQYDPNEKKNLTFLKEKEPANSNIIININKKNNLHLNLSDKKIQNRLNLNYDIPSYKKGDLNSLEEKSSEKIIKNEKEKNSEIESFEKETNIGYSKLKKDLFMDLASCLDKNDNKGSNSKFEINNNRNGMIILRKSTGMETTKMIKKDKTEDKKENLMGSYEPYINFANKTNFFIILFSIGICTSIVDLVLSIMLVVYGNIEIHSMFVLLNIILIIIYSIGIFIIYKNNKYTFKIVSSFQAPEKIDYHRNNLYLIIYLLLLAFGYYFILAIGNIIYKNNVKIDIKGKAYDRNKWKYYFQNKTFKQILDEYDNVNIFFNTFIWISISLLIFILSLFIYFFNSYQFWKRIIQVLYVFFGQISFLLINISQYCFQFKHITSLDEFKLSWVTTGLIIVSIVGVIMSYIGFFVVYTENKKYLKIFNILCIVFFVGFAVFAVGAKALGLKFDDYKMARCNTLFKFISEDYLINNNDCSSKYLFSQETLDGILCPKERIMINWEQTEKKNKENDDLMFGCINQSCCLKIYCKLKTGFNYQEILSIYQLVLYLILFFGGKYILNRIDKIFVEEILEKLNFLILFSLSLLIYLICCVLILFRPKTTTESVLNNIDINKDFKDLTVINKEWISLTNNNILKYESDKLYNELIDNHISSFDYNIIYDYDNIIFNLEYYEYFLLFQFTEVKENAQYNNYYYDFHLNSFENGTNIVYLKSKTNIINKIPQILQFYPYYPFLFKDIFLLTMNLIYSIDKEKIDINNELNKINENNNNISYENTIIISKENILLNYNNSLDLSNITIFNRKNFSLLNNNNNKNITSFYIKGNINNDNGSSLIQLNNFKYNNKIMYSEKSDNNGYFSIGPFYINKNDIFPFEIKIEINKMKNDVSESNIECNNYISNVIINELNFNPYYPFSLMKNILLPKVINKNFMINGYVYDHLNKSLEYINIKLYKGEIDISKSDEVNNHFISQAFTLKNGHYEFNVNSNGQYSLVYYKEDFYMESKNIIINDSNVRVNNVQLIKLFNSGKIVVKLEWDNNPPDLDIICRFQVSSNKDNYCYTFFGNQKCVESNYPLDNKRGGKIGSEIIEIETVSNYMYFFYVRKYFDVSNNEAQNEYKIKSLENEKVDKIDSNYYKENDDFLKNSFSRLSLYTNGIKTPIHIAKIRNEDLKENEFNYWAGFCLNGKQGLKSLKIINKFFVNEPPKNICLSYY